VQKIGQLVEQHLRLAPESQTDALQTALRNQNLRTSRMHWLLNYAISVEDKQDCSNSFLLKPAAAFD